MLLQDTFQMNGLWKDLQVLSASCYHLSPSVHCKFHEPAPLLGSLTQDLGNSCCGASALELNSKAERKWTLRNNTQPWEENSVSIPANMHPEPGVINVTDVWVCNLHSKSIKNMHTWPGSLYQSSSWSRSGWAFLRLISAMTSKTSESELLEQVLSSSDSHSDSLELSNRGQRKNMERS